MRAQEIISNNIANLQTDGFRRDRITFHAHYARALDGAGGAGRNWPHQTVVTRPDDLPGAVYPTGGTLDFAINGPGFFVVQTPSGERFTRSGAFRVGPEGSLLTSGGHKVMGQGGEITLPPGNVTTGADGSIRVNDQVVDTFRLVSIDAQHLTREGQNLFSLSTGGVAGEASPNTLLEAGHLERGNVEPVIEMVEMLRVFREYESNFRAMNVQGDTLRRLIEQQMR